MNIFVYVEGPSDQRSMEALLAPVISRALAKGVVVSFHALEGKSQIFLHGPRKAFNILRNRPDSRVILMPDLHPFNDPAPHCTPAELKKELAARFSAVVREKRVEDDRIHSRFLVHCFKHDLEALLLANEEELRARLGRRNLKRTWKVPVEDQNDDQFPKKVVRELFAEADKIYNAAVDAPFILARGSLDSIVQACPQCFAPFVEDLKKLAGL